MYSLKSMKEVPQELFTRRLHRGESEEDQKSKETLYEALKPLFYMYKIFGLFPLSRPTPGEKLLHYISLNMIYPIMFYITMSTFIVYICTTHVVNMLMGRHSFEVAVVSYSVALTIFQHFLLCPLNWAETRGLLEYLRCWEQFQRIFKMVTGKPLVFIKSKHDSCMMILSCIVVAMLISLSQYILRSRNDLIDEVDFETLFIYWYALVIINLHSGMWSLLCEASLKSSTALRRHFQKHLLGRKETSSRIVDYQKAWLSLSAIYRQTGEAVCYPLLLNILSHFILLVCSVYGLLSASLQGKFGAIELSLLVNIVWSCLVLYSMCNNAHRATVEMKEMFEEIISLSFTTSNKEVTKNLETFLGIINANPPTFTLGNYFTVNRELLVNIFSTIVTYLVVLLQFGSQGGIYEDNGNPSDTNSTILTTNST